MIRSILSIPPLAELRLEAAGTLALELLAISLCLPGYISHY